jgi:hypothetical protein
MAVMVLLARFRALPPDERRALVAALWLLPACSAALRTLGLARVRRLLAAIRPIPGEGPDPRRISYCVDAAASQLLIRPSCLTRSLVLHGLLVRRGIASEVRIGVRFADGRLDAHAWVECAGAPLNAAADVGTRYRPFDGALASGSFTP